MRNKTTDMTRGNPLKLLLAYAGPLMAGQLIQQLYNLADTVIAGQFLGPEAVAAIGAVSALFYLMLGYCMGMTRGYGIILAQLFGAGNRERFRKGVVSMVFLNVVITLLLTLLGMLVLSPLLKLLHTPAEIFQDALDYILIIFGGMLLQSMYNLCASFLQAVGNSRTPLIILIFCSLLNIALDVLLILGCKMSVAGTALATVLAQGASAVLCIVYILRNYGQLLPSRKAFRPDRRITMDMLSTGTSMALMETVYSVGSVVLQGAVNELGTAVLTATTAARKAVDMVTTPLSSFCAACAVFSSQNYGAGHGLRIRKAMNITLTLCAIWSAIAAGLTALIGPVLLRWLTGTSDPKTLSDGMLFLWISTWCSFPLALVLVIRNVLQSTGHKVIPVVASMIELVMKVVSAFTFVRLFGFVGAASTEPATWVVCGLFLLLVWMREKQKLTDPSPLQEE